MAMLMRHRAVRLACVGLGLWGAAFVPSLRLPALTFAALSKLSFLALYLMTPGLTSELQRVAAVDVVALAGGRHDVGTLLLPHRGQRDYDSPEGDVRFPGHGLSRVRAALA